MNAPFSHFLARFAEVIPPPALAIDPAPHVAQVTLDGAELARRLDDARLEARRAAEAEHEGALAALMDDHREELARSVAEARSIRLAREGEGVAALVESAFADLRARLSGQIADALRPLLAEALAQRARAALAEALERILADADHPRVIVRGPTDFLAVLRGKHTSGEMIDYVVDDAIDIAVAAGATSITTRLGAALATLQGEA